MFIVFIPFYRCVKVFLFLEYTCHMYFCILTYCTLGLKVVNLRMYTMMSHIVVFYIPGRYYISCQCIIVVLLI